MAVAARPELHWVLRLQRGFVQIGLGTNTTFTQNLARRAMGGVDKSCGLAHDGHERDEGEPRARCVRRARGEFYSLPPNSCHLFAWSRRPLDSSTERASTSSVFRWYRAKNLCDSWYRVGGKASIGSCNTYRTCGLSIRRTR